MSRQSASRPGLTLVELLVAISLTAIVTGVITLVFQRTFKTYAIETKRGELQIEAVSALDRLTRQIRQATRVVSSAGSHTTGANILAIELPSVDSNQKIITNTYDTVVYRRDATNPDKLQEITIANAASSRPSSTRNLLDNVSAFTVSYLDANGNAVGTSYTAAKRLTVQIDSTATTYTKTLSHKARQTIILRNK